MAATAEDIIRLLRQRKILASNAIQELLQTHSDPAALLDLGPQIDFHRGVLSEERLGLLQSLFDADKNQISVPTKSNIDTRPTDLGRVIAPISVLSHWMFILEIIFLIGNRAIIVKWQTMHLMIF